MLPTPSLEQRVARIEESARSWRAVAVAAIGLAVVAFGIAAHSLFTPTELRLANGDGTELVLRADRLTMSDENWREIVRLDGKTEGNLRLVGEHDKSAELSARSIVSLILTGEHADRAPIAQQAITQITASENKSTLSSFHHGQHLDLDASVLGTKLTMIGDDDQGPYVSLSTGGKLDPVFQMSTKNRRESVVLEAGPYRTDVSISDQKGSRTLTSTP